MKTIYTTLPIYDKLSKQRYERSKRVSGDKAMLHPTITPRHRLPAFQWLDNGDGATSVERVEAVNADYTGVETSLSGSWYGIGLHNNFDTFVSAGLNITSAITIAGGGGFVDSSAFAIVENTEYILRGTLTLNSGDLPYIYLDLNPIQLNAGAVEIIYKGRITGNLSYTISSPTPSNFSFTSVTIKEVDNALPLNVFMSSLPASYIDGTSTWFTYESDTLNYLLPEGLYYLKITMDTGAIYYSDWFLVDCVFENLITEWVNSMYNSFTSSGTTITGVTSGIAGGNASSDSFNLIAGEKVTLIFYLTHLFSPSEAPSFTLYDNVTFHEETYVASAGLNVIEFTALGSNSYTISITNTTNSGWRISEAILIRDYSEKYLKFDFEHSCNLGDINYESGFEQTLYLESEPLESAFPYVEKGAENGYGRFVPTYQRQDKTYIIRTKLVADYIVDVLQRLKLHDTVILTDLVGDIWNVEEIDTEQTWQFDDKYYALATITVDLGEGIAITGCCTAINEC